MSFKWIWINSINICIEYLLRMWRKLHKVAYLKGKRHEHHLDLHLFRMYFYFFCLHILNLVPSLTPFLCHHCWFYCYSFFSFLTSSQSFFHPSPTSIHLHITAHPASILSSLLQLLTILLRSYFLPPFLIHPTASLAWPTVTICLPAFVSLNFQELIWRKCSFLNITSHPLSCSLTVSLKSIYILLHIT